MKHTKIIITVILLFSAIGLSAQSKDIQQIKKWYYATKKQIDNSKKTKKGYNCIVLERNAYKNQGVFYLKQEFWENPQGECHDNPSGCLKILIINSSNYYAEYLYQKGALVFVFIKDYLNEFRFYFKNDKLIKEIKGTKVGEGMYTPNVDDVRRNSSIYMNQYLANFCIPND